VAAGLVALLGLACVAFRADDGAAAAEPGNALAVQSLASSGFKVIAGWESQHHAYARKCPRVPQSRAPCASAAAAANAPAAARAALLAAAAPMLCGAHSTARQPLTGSAHRLRQGDLCGRGRAARAHQA
jgi:hypothetical protein